MQDRFLEKAPGKINLFLKILNKRSDNYHNIQSAVTIVNLFDEIIAEKSSKFSLNYVGKFAPKNNYFEDCIILKLFDIFEIKKPNFNFVIKKNIPVQSGLGSASSNAAAIIRILDKLDLIKLSLIKNSTTLSSDLPIFLNQKDCEVGGIGDELNFKFYPKFYFLLVKPSFGCSTKKMYNLINIQNNKDKNNFDENVNLSEKNNDFEIILTKQNKEINEILKFLKLQQHVIFARLTGSGSCCFATFEKKQYAINAKQEFEAAYPNLWNCVVENNYLS